MAKTFTAGCGTTNPHARRLKGGGKHECLPHKSFAHNGHFQTPAEARTFTNVESASSGK